MKNPKAILYNPRLQIVGGFVFLLLATLDLIIQGRNYDFDLQSLRYLSIIGKIFFGIAAGLFMLFIANVIIEVFKQIFGKK